MRAKRCTDCGRKARTWICPACKRRRRKLTELLGRDCDQPKRYALFKRPLVLAYRRRAAAGLPLFPEAKGA